MSERTKGRLTAGRIVKQSNFGDKKMYLDAEQRPGVAYVHFRKGGICTYDECLGNAAHLVACWNAFEPGGAVELARTALRDLVRATEDHSPKCLCDSCAYRGEAIAALSALDAARAKP